MQDTMYTQSAETSFRVGASVFVRDESNRSWLSGAVTNVDPLLVQVQGWPIPMSFKFVVKHKPSSVETEVQEERHDVSRRRFYVLRVSTEVREERYQTIGKTQIGQVIGANGTMINRIRRGSRAQVTVYDRKSFSVSSLPDMQQRNVSSYVCVVKIVGSRHQVST